MVRKHEDPVVDSAIRKALVAQTIQSAEGCPDENIVTAYLENRLLDSEKSRFEGHASSCARCQELLALSMKLASSQDSRVIKDSTSPVNRKVLFHFSVPLSALALMIVALAIGVVFYREARFSKFSQPKTETSQVRTLAPSGPVAEEHAVLPKTASSDISVGSKDAPQKVGEPVQAFKRDGIGTTTPVARQMAATPTAPPAEQKSTLGTLIKKETDQDKVTASVRRDELPSQPAAAAGVAVTRPREVEAREKDALNSALPDDRKKAAVGGAQQKSSSATLDKRETDQDKVAALPQRVVVESVSTPLAQAPDALRMNQPLTPVTVIRAFSQQLAQREDNTTKRAAMQASESQRPQGPKSQTVQNAPTSRKVGDRTFSQFSGYWIDAECGKHPDAQIVEITEKAEAYAKILQKLPQIGELQADRTPVLLFFDGRNYVLR